MNYRELQLGDIVQKDDEVRAKVRYTENWYKCGISIGLILTATILNELEFRRPI